MQTLWASCIFVCCLWKAINGASVLPPTTESEKCVFISTNQSIESQAHEKLQAMNSAQCITPDGSGATLCQTNKKKYEYVKLECFCAGKPNDQSIECNPSHVTLCCKYNNAVCLNNGTLNKTESNCSAKPKPIYKCKCLPVLNGTGYYQGERCENIPVIRECVYKASGNVNGSLNSCSDENDVSRKCIHRVIDTSYECGPARQDINGIVYKMGEDRIVYKMCEDRIVYKMCEDRIVYKMGRDHPPSKATDSPGNSVVVLALAVGAGSTFWCSSFNIGLSICKKNR